MNSQIRGSLKHFTAHHRNIAAISGVLLMILTFAVLKGCSRSREPEPVQPAKPPHGTLTIPANMERLVSESLAEGKIFYEKEGTQDPRPLILTPDRTIELPQGKYRLLTIWELEDSTSTDGAQFIFRNPNFTIRQDQPCPLDLGFKLFTPSWKHPRLPEVAGAETVWTGTFQRYRSSKNASSEITYKLKITTLNEGTIEQFPCRWLRVELVTNAALAPTVTETAFLAVDTSKWKTSQEFVVRRGWIQATSEDIQAELEAISSSPFGKATAGQLPSLRELTMEFDPDRDVIANKAIELDAPLPEDRLSLLDVLSLVMDADLKGASQLCVAMRAQLSKLNVSSFHKSMYKSTDGTFNCLGVSSQIVSDDLHFDLRRNDILVPFSLVEVFIEHPNLEASLRLNKYYLPDSDQLVDSVDEARLADAVEKLKALPEKTRFDLAAIPKEDGVQVNYTGTMTAQGTNAEISYGATVATLATESRENRQCRWLRVEVTTNGPGETIREAAVILVDPAEYAATHKLPVLEGWLIYSGNNKEHVLPFALNGNMQKAEEDLQMLQFDLAAGRLSLHDALALLFNARLLESPSKFNALRGQFEDPAGRVMTRQKLKLKDGPEIPGKVWTFKTTDSGQLNYTFKRSERIPFSVFSMDLTIGPVKLITNLESYGPSTQPQAAFDKTVWEDRAKETQNQVADWKKRNPNFRFFTISTKSEVTRLLAEWAGERKPDPKTVKRDFFLKPLRGEQKQYTGETQLSTDDETWKAEERYWSGLGEPAVYVPEERILSGKAPASGEIKLSIDGEEKKVPWDSLSPDEHRWVWQANINLSAPRKIP